MSDFPFRGGLLEEFKVAGFDISLPKLSDFGSSKIDPVKVGDVGSVKLGDIEGIKLGDVGAIKLGDVDPVKVGDVGAVKLGDVESVKVGDVGSKVGAVDTAGKIGETGGKLVSSSDVDTIVLKQQVDVGAQKVQSDSAGKVTVPEPEAAKVNKARSWLSENLKYVIGGVTAAIIASVALARWQQKDGKVFNIVGIDPADNGVRLTLADGEDFSTDDWIDVRSSNSLPSVDGNGIVIKSVLGRNSIVIPGTVTTKGTAGEMTLHTSFEAQLKGTISDAARGVIDTGQVVTEGVLEGASDALGLGPLLATAKKWAVPAIITVVVIVLVIFVFGIVR